MDRTRDDWQGLDARKGRRMTRTQRVWQLIHMLQEKWHPNDELAQLFGVSPRTIRADLLYIGGEPFCQAVERRMACRIATSGEKPAT